MSKNVTLTLRGKAMYAKVLGDPVLNFDKSGKEWKLDFIPNDEKAVAKELASYGISDRLRSKTKADGSDLYDGKKFMSFRQKEFTAEGKRNNPIEVVDILGRSWDEQNLIGNESVIDIRFAVVDFGPGKKKGVYPRRIRVLQHVPYEDGGFEKISEDDEYFQAAVAAAEAEERGKENLNDDVPV